MKSEALLTTKMLPTDRISQLRKGDLGSGIQEGVGGYHSLVEGSLQQQQQGEEVQTAEGQNCTVASNLPPVVANNYQDQGMSRAFHICPARMVHKGCQ